MQSRKKRRRYSDNMNQDKIGTFIAACRKEKKLTQAQLAEKLGITDRAISKWERGKSMPDSSIMLELCEVLGITVNELLIGEKIAVENLETAANETLITLKKADEKHLSLNKIISVIFCAALFIAVITCMVCDVALHGTCTWSLIVLDCAILAWFTLIPLTLAGRRGIPISLAALTALILPYLYILSRLIEVSEVFSIGAAMSVFCVVYLWLIFAVFHRLGGRRLTAAGITCLLAVPFMLGVNVTLSHMLGEPAVDGWDALSVLLLLVIAGVFFVCGRVWKK